jgi:hypothetical protein
MNGENLIGVAIGRVGMVIGKGAVNESSIDMFPRGGLLRDTSQTRESLIGI